MKNFILTDFIFFISISYISTIIIIPFQTYNPFLTKNETLLNLIKNTSDKNLVNTISRNLVYINLNIGQNAQTISTFIEMTTTDLTIKDMAIKGRNKIGQIRNMNFTYRDNYLLKSIFRNVYYDSKISESYTFINECFYRIKDFLSIKNLCGNETIFFRQKNNINDKENIKTIDLYMRFQEMEEFDHRPAIIGFSYYNNFISELKEKHEINSYDFSFKYTNTKEESGELIMGDLPHIYDSDNYKEENLRSANIIKGPTVYWGINFDIYLSSKYKTKKDFILSVEEDGFFYIEEFFITGSQKYFTYIEENFFQKYIDKRICSKSFYNKAYYTESFFYFMCNIEDENKRKEFFDEFPDLIFSQRDMDYKFRLTAEDLFTIIPDGKRILFNVDFVYNRNKWILGKPFLKKYQLIFNSDSNTISYYINPNNKIINKEEGNKGGNGLKIFLIIFFVILAFIVGIVFGRALCIKYNRKLRANELEDNFSYIVNDRIKENENEATDINLKKDNYKSKYYCLN